MVNTWLVNSLKTIKIDNLHGKYLTCQQSKTIKIDNLHGKYLTCQQSKTIKIVLATLMLSTQH